MKRGLTILLLIMLLGACKKEFSDEFFPYTNIPLNDTVWTKNTVLNTSADTLLKALTDMDSPEIIDSFSSIKSGDTLHLKDSIQIIFNAGNPNEPGFGGPLTNTGNYVIHVILLQKRGEFIRFKKPTTSENALLESGGSIFIRITKNGRDLVLANGTSFKIRYRASDISNNMRLFYGKETLVPPSDTVFTWMPSSDTSKVNTWEKRDLVSGNIIAKGYELFSKQLRWINCAKFLDISLPKTNIYATLPSNYTNKNTLVFAVFKDQKTVLNLKADFNNKTFIGKDIPTRSKITLVSLSKIGDNYYWGIKEVNDVGTVVNYSITPEKKTLLEIKTFLDTL